MGHVLRKFKNEDARGVKELILAILTKEYPFDKSAYSDSDLDRIGEVYGGERETFFVIEDNGVIAGTVGVKMDSKEDALLRRLFVNPAYRRRGFGSELLNKAVFFCRDKGYRRIYFRCTDRMADAMKLCSRNGFKKKETLPVSGFNIHKMELAL